MLQLASKVTASFERIFPHAILAIAAVALVLLFSQMSLFLWIGPFGWPLGAPGAHDGFMGGPRILVVPLIGLLTAGLTLASVRRAHPSRRLLWFLSLTAVTTTLAYFLTVDWGLLWGLIFRPLSHTLGRDDNWWMVGQTTSRILAWVAFLLALEIPWLLVYERRSD